MNSIFNNIQINENNVNNKKSKNDESETIFFYKEYSQLKEIKTNKILKIINNQPKKLFIVLLLFIILIPLFLIFKTFFNTIIVKKEFDKDKFVFLNSKACNCSNTAVLIVNEKSPKIINQLLETKFWCIIAVTNKNLEKNNYSNKECIKYLNDIEIEKLPFKMKQLNYNKNLYIKKMIGYLYAMSVGAKVIFDTNGLIEIKKKKGIDKFPTNFDDVNSKSGFFKSYYKREKILNPYIYFDPVNISNNNYSRIYNNFFPRGINVNDSYFERKWMDYNIKIPTTKKIGVLNSLIDNYPDEDSNDFEIQKIFLKYEKIISIPPGIFSPFNEISTFWFENSFWGMIFPIVEIDLMDIFRAYIYEKVIESKNLLVAFSSSIVKRMTFKNLFNKNVFHKNEKINSLIQILIEYSLNHSSCTINDFAKSLKDLENLYKYLFQKNIISQDSLNLFNIWIQDLQNLYDFNKLNKNHEKFFSDKKIPHRTFQSTELHIGTIRDHSSILMSLNHSFIFDSRKGNLLHLFDFDYSNQYTIAEEIQNTPLAMTYGLTSYLGMDVRKNHFNFMKNLKFKYVKDTDAFICQFLTSTCIVWKAFNQSIIWLPSHRYLIGHCSKEGFQELTNLIIKSYNKTRTEELNHPHDIVAASERFDYEYLNYFTGAVPKLFWASSHNYMNKYLTFCKYSSEEIIIGPSQLKRVPVFFQKGISRVNHNYKFTTLKEKYGNYKYPNMCEHKAIVFLPYATHSYGIIEFYALNVPLFFPTIDFLIKLNTMFDYSIFLGAYCGKVKREFLPKKHDDSPHLLCPEDTSIKSLKYWLFYSDFYQLPFITYFDSWEDLINKLNSAKFEEIRKKMEFHNKYRHQEIIQMANYISENIDSHRKIPYSWQEAVKLYEV